MNAAVATQRLAQTLERARRRRFPDATLSLILNAGGTDEAEFKILDGWGPLEQQPFGEERSLYKIMVIDREELTVEVMDQADRLRLNGVNYAFTYDPPVVAPMAWTFYATERKAGGLK